MAQQYTIVHDLNCALFSRLRFCRKVVQQTRQVQLRKHAVLRRLEDCLGGLCITECSRLERRLYGKSW